MSIVTQLQKRLTFHEGRVATLKVVIEELNADAMDRFPSKFKQAMRLRGTVGDDGAGAPAPELSHIKKPKKHRRRPRFVFGRSVAAILGSMAIQRKSLLDTLHKQGMDGRGLGTLVRNGFLKLQGDKYRLTQTGRAHYEVAARPTTTKKKQAKRGKGNLVATVVQILGKGRLPKTELSAALHEHGIDPRGNIANLVRHGFIQKNSHGYALTAKARRNDGAKEDGTGRKRRAAKPTVDGTTNGRSKREAIEYVAEMLKANGPMSGPAILVAAKEGGRKISAQTLGAAMRHHLIEANGPRGEQRLYNVPA